MKNIIIYKLNPLYLILEELSTELDYNIIYGDNEQSLNDKIKNLNNLLIITDRKYLNVDNQIILNNCPINILKLVERINIELLKLQFNNQSRIKINNYTIDLNSREIANNINKIKLTEKEIDIIIYLSKSKNVVSIKELQDKVWSYQFNIETHTVETHIYRLRKKFLNSFKDDKFIINEKYGYQIK
jgi:hypothetical protein